MRYYGAERLADCTPYLLQLGLTKSKTSLVWIAGPLSGIIMQPVVGVLADNSRSKWGRRRPFMVGGAVIVALCLLVLGWTAEIVGLFITEPDMVGHQEKTYTRAKILRARRQSPTPLRWPYLVSMPWTLQSMLVGPYNGAIAWKEKY